MYTGKFGKPVMYYYIKWLFCFYIFPSWLFFHTSRKYNLYQQQKNIQTRNRNISSIISKSQIKRGIFSSISIEAIKKVTSRTCQCRLIIITQWPKSEFTWTPPAIWQTEKRNQFHFLRIENIAAFHIVKQD